MHGAFMDSLLAGESLYATLWAMFPADMGGTPVIAAVGGGGKTGTLFALAASLANAGLDVSLTTTTHIRDPRSERGRRFDEVIIDASLALSRTAPAGQAERNMGGAVPGHMTPGAGRSGRITVIGSAAESGTMGPRLLGIHPTRVRDLPASGAAVLVEADGSRMLPVKAPASHEPAMPEGADIVLGLIGLDCLGRPMDGYTVHRHELFGDITGCFPGQPIVASHLRALAEAPLGLFKDAPPGALRILVLNKADMMDENALGSIEREFAVATPRGIDAVLLYSARFDAARCLACARGLA